MKFRILEIFQENSGDYSSTRVMTFLIVVSMIIDWQYAVWTVGAWHPDWAIIGLVAGVLGAKVAQKPFENKTNNSETEEQIMLMKAKKEYELELNESNNT